MPTMIRYPSAAVFLCAALIGGCGGGGDDAAGAPTELSVVPSEMAFTFGAGATSCAPINVGTPTEFPGWTTVIINGGAGDFRVTSTRPTEIEISPVIRVNGVYQFSFRLVGATCYPGEGTTIQVTDVRRNFAHVKVTATIDAAP